MKHGKYKIGDIIDLHNFLSFDNIKQRLAIVIEIRKHFVICQSLKGGYKECLNTLDGKILD